LSKFTNLKHASNQIINSFVSVTPVSALLEGMSLFVKSSLGGFELERPQEVVSFLEVSSASVEFSDQVFNADDVSVAKNLLNNLVVCDGDSLLVDLTVSSLIDQIGDSMSGGESESDKRFDLLEHVKSGSVNSDEDGVV